MHYIMIFKFSAKIVGFKVFFERFLTGRWSSLQIHIFSTPERELNANIRLLNKVVNGLNATQAIVKAYWPLV